MGEGDGVALFIANSPEALLLKLAVHFIGGRLVFVPPEPGNPELGAFIAQAHVYLVPDGGTRPDLGEIRRLVAQALGDLYQPKSLSVVARLPRTTLGKIDKKSLRAAYQAEAGNDIADDAMDRRS